jgi:choline dehydrogenase-like flavoprotein
LTLGLFHMQPGHLFHRFPYVKTDIPIAGCAHQASTVVSGSDLARTGAQHRLRARELDSLYVDSSFFPQHQHGEPALTAMASALRVGGHLSNDSAEQRGADGWPGVVSRQRCGCGGYGVAR